MKPMPSGYKLHDYIIGAQIGKGSNAAVYEAAARFTPKREEEEEEEVKLREEEEEVKEGAPSLTCCSFRKFPLAIKMMWNFGVGISHFHTRRGMLLLQKLFIHYKQENIIRRVTRAGEG